MNQKDFYCEHCEAFNLILFLQPTNSKQNKQVV